MKSSQLLYKRLLDADKERDDDSSKLIINGARVFSTRDLTKSKVPEPDKTIKVFKPSIGFKIYGLLFVSFFWFAYLFGIYKTTNINAAGAAVGLFVILFITMIILRQLFYDETYNFTIYIDKEGIQVDYELFIWSDIKETAIINYPTRGKGTDYLVVIRNDNTYGKFDLTNFSILHGIRKRLATYIEHFKQSKENLA